MKKLLFFFKLFVLIIFPFLLLNGFILTPRQLYSSPAIDSNQPVMKVVQFCSKQNWRNINKRSLPKDLPKNFRYKTHLDLLDNFPDWEERVNYQAKQYKFYRQAQIKLQQIPFTVINREQYLTYQEQQSLHYFCGTEDFETWQHYTTEPNVFDTRQSFIIKMQDEEMRDNFLNSWHKYYENKKDLKNEE